MSLEIAVYLQGKKASLLESLMSKYTVQLCSRAMIRKYFSVPCSFTFVS